MMNLTKKEIEFLAMTLNADTVEGQLDDNYSNAGIEEAEYLFRGVHKSKASRLKAAGGLLSSLTKKGFGMLDEEDDIFWLTGDEEKMKEIFEAVESLES